MSDEKWWLWPLLNILVWFHNRKWIRKHYQYFGKAYIRFRDLFIWHGVKR
jgi:hypothetical protein